MNTDESIELAEEDFEEPPPTDPCPGVLPALSVRIDPSDDDLEKRLAWLAQEVRTTSAEQAKIRREQTVLERREYKSVPVAVDTKQQQDPDLPKVTLAVGVDPKRDPTLVGRRISEHHWDFDIVDPEELSRTLPLDTQASLSDPLPFQPSMDKPVTRRATSARVFLSLFVFFLVGLSLQHLAHTSTRAALAAMPMAKRGLEHARLHAELRYDQAETVRMLAPSSGATMNVPKEPITTTSAIAPIPTASSTVFKYVMPRGSSYHKSSTTTTAPSAQTSVLLAPIPRDTLGF